MYRDGEGGHQGTWLVTSCPRRRWKSVFVVDDADQRSSILPRMLSDLVPLPISHLVWSTSTVYGAVTHRSHCSGRSGKGLHRGATVAVHLPSRIKALMAMQEV